MPSVLIVEDMIQAQKIKVLLESWGYKVTGIVDNEKDAIDHALEDKPDIIIIDVMLTGTDGFKVAKSIKEKMDTPIILLTPKLDDKISRKVKEVEAAAYIIKPFKDSELKYTIKGSLYKHKMDKLLLKAQGEYQSILDTTMDGVWKFNENAIIDYCNEQLARILGYKVDEIIGKYFHEFVHPDGLETCEKIYESCKKGVSGEHEIRFIKKNGKPCWLIVSKTPIFDGSTYKGGFCIFKDISDHKRLEIGFKLLNEVNRSRQG